MWKTLPEKYGAALEKRAGAIAQKANLLITPQDSRAAQLSVLLWGTVENYWKSPMSHEPNTSSNQDDQKQPDLKAVDPRDLVSKPGYGTADPREIIENPAVTPERLDDPPSDLRSDLVAGDDESMMHHQAGGPGRSRSNPNADANPDQDH